MKLQTGFSLLGSPQSPKSTQPYSGAPLVDVGDIKFARLLFNNLYANLFCLRGPFRREAVGGRRRRRRLAPPLQPYRTRTSKPFHPTGNPLKARQKLNPELIGLQRSC
ncbi:hypothetical protein EVAR_63911_1 [Eumeta japonica]|uniref:Uncharacterized protein n=1 Tax=Eumeta variegata TaxID=151549 RepID=A0A4C1ZM23_EUMVA|nr:hypothetical protein EVAR_63911_1 [Eumeta japonica]